MTPTIAKTFNLRLPLELRNWLEQEAKRNMRSLNNEIVFKLLQSKDADGIALERQTGQRPV